MHKRTKRFNEMVLVEVLSNSNFDSKLVTKGSGVNKFNSVVTLIPTDNNQLPRFKKQLERTFGKRIRECGTKTVCKEVYVLLKWNTSLLK